MIERRDAELGAILDQIEVLEHGPGYWETVLSVAEPELVRLRATAAADARGGHREANEPRERRRHPIAALIERHPTFGGGFRVPIWLGVALVAVIVAVTLVGLPQGGGNGVSGPQPASAAEAIRLSLDVLTDAEAVEGTSRTYDNGFTENGDTVLSLANTFLATRDGSVRLESIPGEGAYYPGSFYGPEATRTVVYDALSRRFQYLLDAGPGGAVNSVEEVAAGKHSRYQWYEHRHVAPGPPDSPQTLDDVPLWRLRAYLRTLLSTPGVELDVRSVDGRPSWVVKAPWVVGSGTYRATIAIDATTRLPYEVKYRLGDRLIEWRLDIAVRDAPVDPSVFAIQKPPAGETERGYPGGDVYTFVDLPVEDAVQVRRRTKSMPVLPSWVPRGFELRDATVTNGREGVFIVSLVYRRGFDQITVTTRPDPRLFRRSLSSVDGSRPVRTDTSNPFIPEMHPRTRAAWAAQTVRVRLASGAYADRAARVITDPGYWPHLWVKKNGYVGTVAGDLTVGQMKRVAESLVPWQGDDDD